ncbi:MAG: hypothetical protein PG977_001249 [Bartonella clarridgeiae]|nr:MAG: hypothetical protein PG977_001249 [Bartonella clarridgeiae]
MTKNVQKSLSRAFYSLNNADPIALFKRKERRDSWVNKWCGFPS